MRFIPILLALVFLCFSAHAQYDTARNVETYRVIGMEFPGQYKHPASITQLDDGDLYLAYYGGSGEYEDDTAVYGMRYTNANVTARLEGASTRKVWTTPEVIANTPGIGEGNPVVWQAPDGKVWLFYVNRYGDTWSDARTQVKISEDGAQTWSDSFILSFERGSMVRGQPIVLNDGDYLLPMYHETGDDISLSAPSTSSYFLRYDPKTKEWTESSRITSETGNLQAQVVQIDDDYLFAYIRRGGNFEPTETGYMLRSESRDGGQTWTEAVDTEFKNPNSAVDLIKLQSGNLLLIYNDNMNERTPLTVTISTDNGETWPHTRNIMGGDNTYAYPYAIQTEDGKIHIIYTTNVRTTIMHSVFEEEAILAGWE